MLIDRIKKNFFTITTILLLILLDFITKWLIILFLKENIIIFRCLEIIKSYNKGGIFGFGNNSLWFRIFLILFRFLFLLLLIFSNSFFRNKNFCSRISYTLLCAGCIGNLIDILFYWPKICGFNGVIDWIHLNFLFFNYVFNLADVYISLAVIFLIIYFLYPKNDRHKIQ